MRSLPVIALLSISLLVAACGGGNGSPAADDTGGNLSHVPLHMADLGTDNYERENTLHLLANEERLLGEIAAALERINRGTFGTCEECGGSILPKERLKELPYTRYCVECAKKQDGKRS